MSQSNQAPVLVNKTKNRLQTGCWAVLLNLLFAGFCLWGVLAVQTSWKLETEGVTTTGIVASMKETTDTEGSCCVYSPVIEFQAGGRTYSFPGGTATYPPQYQVGQSVQVRYHPSDPENAQIENFFDRWLVPIISILAILLTAIIVNLFIMLALWRGSRLGG